MRRPFGINRPILVSLNTRLGKSAVLYPAALYFSVCFMVITASLFLHNVKSDRHVEPRRQKAGVNRDESTFLRFPSRAGIVSILAVVLPIYGVEILNLSEKAVGFMLLTRAAATLPAGHGIPGVLRRLTRRR